MRRGYGILTALLVAAVVVFNADRIAEWMRGYIDVVAFVPESSGVRAGSPVWVEGTHAGRVQSVAVSGHGDSALVVLELRLEDRVRPVVRSASTVYTARKQLIGQPVVHVRAGPPASPPLSPGDTLQAAARLDISLLVEKGKDFPILLDSLMTAVREVQRLADTRAPRVASLLERFLDVSAAAGRLGEDLQGGTLGRFARDTSITLRLEQLRDRMDQLSVAAAELSRYGSSPELSEGVPSLMHRAERIGADLERLQTAMDGNLGTLPRLQRDSALAVALAGVTAQIDSLRAEGLSFGLRMLVP